MKPLPQIITEFIGKKIIVFGDLLVDEYVFGRTSRVSREAPIVIINFLEKRLFLGGGANVVNNIHALGAIPVPIGVVGDDEAGHFLLSTLTEKKVPTDLVIQETGWVTTLKTRIFGGDINTGYQQVCRIDREGGELRDSIKERLWNSFLEYSKTAEGIIISDYGVGLVSGAIVPAINEFASHDSLPLTVDSRFGLMNFSHMTAILPNETEAEKNSGIEIREDSDLLKIGQMLMEQVHSQSVVIKRGKKGMFLLERDSFSHHFIEAFGKSEITDNTGAGDTVIAVFTAALTSKADFHQAAVISNIAGGLVVQKKGPATVSQNELMNAVSSIEV